MEGVIMNGTRNHRVRLGVVIGVLVLLCLAGCSENTNKKSTEYDTQVKVEVTADEKDNAGAKDTDSMVSNEEATYAINLNQIGYRPNDKKIAMVSNNNGIDTYQVLDEAGNTVYSGKLLGRKWDNISNSMVQFADLSSFKKPGSYYLICGDVLYSDEFTIGEDVYQEYYDAIGNYFSDMQKKATALEQPDKEEPICATIYGTDQQIDVTGGLYDLKIRGQYVVDSCTTIASMLLLYDTYYDLGIKEIEKKNLEPGELLALVKQELKWLLKLQNTQGGVYHKVTVANEEKSEDGLYVFPVSTCATADFSAVMAKAYGYFLKSDKEFANTCLVAAQKAWIFLENNKESITFANPENVTTSEFKDDDDRDERFWAAIELSLTTKRSDYVSYVADHIDTGFYIGFTWQRVAGYGVLDAITGGKDIFSTDTYTRMNTIMETKVNSISSHVDKVTYQVNLNSSATFQTIISEAITMYLMASNENKMDLYYNSKIFLDFLMGANAYSENYIGESQEISSLDMDYIAKLSLLLVGINEEYSK